MMPFAIRHKETGMLATVSGEHGWSLSYTRGRRFTSMSALKSHLKYVNYPDDKFEIVEFEEIVADILSIKEVEKTVRKDSEYRLRNVQVIEVNKNNSTIIKIKDKKWHLLT